MHFLHFSFMPMLGKRKEKRGGRRKKERSEGGRFFFLTFHCLVYIKEEEWRIDICYLTITLLYVVNVYIDLYF